MLLFNTILIYHPRSGESRVKLRLLEGTYSDSVRIRDVVSRCSNLTMKVNITGDEKRRFEPTLAPAFGTLNKETVRLLDTNTKVLSKTT